MRSEVATLLVLLIACRPNPQGLMREHEALRRSVDEHAHALDGAEVDTTALVERVDRLRERYLSAERDLVAAESLYRRVAEMRRGERRMLEEAGRTFAVARERWQLAQYAIMAAAFVDVQNMQSANRMRGLSPGCDGVMSTSAFRRLKAALGVIVAGLDVDHILPLALGGADHPDNYQLIPSGLNRSFGARWGPEKCAWVGREACARAVAISRRCGSYTGGVPGE